MTESASNGRHKGPFSASALLTIILAPIASTLVAGVATWVTLAARLDVEVESLGTKIDALERRLEISNEKFETVLNKRVHRIEEELKERTVERFTSTDAKDMENDIMDAVNLIHQILAERIEALNARMRRMEGHSAAPPPPY